MDVGWGYSDLESFTYGDKRRGGDDGQKRLLFRGASGRPGEARRPEGLEPTSGVRNLASVSGVLLKTNALLGSYGNCSWPWQREMRETLRFPPGAQRNTGGAEIPVENCRWAFVFSGEQEARHASSPNQAVPGEA